MYLSLNTLTNNSNDTFETIVKWACMNKGVSNDKYKPITIQTNYKTQINYNDTLGLSPNLT